MSALLEKEPYRFNFFQAVRVLEKLYADRQGVGADSPPHQECVRLRSLPSLVFPPSDLYACTPAADDHPASLTVAFLGLYGPDGAMPRYYTELILERLRQKDSTLRDFLDLFNHRLLSLFYRAWKKYRFWLSYEQAERIGRVDYSSDPARLRSFVTEVRPRIDVFGQAVLDLAGFGSAPERYRATVRSELVPRSSVTDLTLRYYAGIFANQRRSALGLEAVLQGHFSVPVTIRQAIGRWLLVETEHQTQLAARTRSALGGAAMIGQRYWDVQGKFRIQLGPLTYADFDRFLPSGEAHRRIADLTFLYTGLHPDADLQLILEGPEVPWCQMGGGTQAAPQLGWNTWIRNQPFTDARYDAILSIESATVGASP